MNLSEVSEEKKLIMHSLYMTDDKVTYADIAQMYKSTYPDLTEGDVGKIIRDRDKSNEGIVPIVKENALIQPIKKIVERNNINVMRRNID